MEFPAYGLTRKFEQLSYRKAIENTTAALKTEGFGVLSSIDISATLKKKIDVDFRPYTILGACNPPLAYGALSVDPFVGLLLPCNVVVMAGDDGGSVVSIVNPPTMFQVVDKPELEPVVAEVEARLRRVLDRIEG